ncbi:MAG: hypothetical protein AVDCRST_MAG93-1426, partial [uncultured Chloroflexia bacterium]
CVVFRLVKLHQRSWLCSIFPGRRCRVRSMSLKERCVDKS